MSYWHCIGVKDLKKRRHMTLLVINRMDALESMDISIICFVAYFTACLSYVKSNSQSEMLTLYDSRPTLCNSSKMKVYIYFFFFQSKTSLLLHHNHVAFFFYSTTVIISKRWIIVPFSVVSSLNPFIVASQMLHKFIQIFMYYLFIAFSIALTIFSSITHH